MITGMGEFDRVMGGGIIPSSVILLGGDPGIGKSTIILHAMGLLSRKGNRVIYVSGEESTKQIKLRADRIKALSDNLLVVSETNINAIIGYIEDVKPTAVVIDSIQTMYLTDLESAPGSVSQVRESASRLMYTAKGSGLSVFLIGHVTKEGAIAGPRVLEHMVDTVLYLEGDKHYLYRVLRATKNRFGSTNEMGIFEMRESGMVQVENPSEIFLSQRSKPGPGSVVVCSMEGTRPLLIEIQALVAPANFGVPQRVTTGIDRRRLSIIVAVLEKRIGLGFGTHDIFLNVVGGVRIEEPAVDLGSALALASSFKEAPVDQGLVAIGEVGLGGEIRPVSQAERRIAEAGKLGFQRCVLSDANLDGIRKPDGIELIGVSKLEEALEVTL
jgi:DNA repair protein RadA/Sms